MQGCGDTENDLPAIEEDVEQAPARPPSTATDEITAIPTPGTTDPLHLTPQVVTLRETAHLMKEKEFLLNVPEGFTITPVAEGMRRVRFMAISPDKRLFATDMKDLSDNSQGKVWVLDNYDSVTRRYGSRSAWLEGLRNPNNVAFHTDGGATWLYIGLTDRLVRYRYKAGSSGPTGRPETLMRFPDSGRGYREGGWHLTRTVAFGKNGKLYVSVGSSCNVCVEKEEEEVRATIVEMNPDGSGQKIYARGLRNAVGLRSVDGMGLFATNMGADHLGLDRPEDNFYRIEEDGDYGWPWAYEFEGKIIADPTYGTKPGATLPDSVTGSIAGFAAHASPLGFDWFAQTSHPSLRNTFLVALHGSGAVSMGRGYRVMRVGADGVLGDFINGFLVGDKRYGRPCDILRTGPDSFLLSDDYAGVIYLVHRSDQ